MEKWLDVIKVTTDVYDEPTARQHFAEEKAKGNYQPMLHVRSKKVHGRPEVAFCVCRKIETPDDRIFADQVQRDHNKNERKWPFVEEVRTKELFVIDRGDLKPATVN